MSPRKKAKVDPKNAESKKTVNEEEHEEESNESEEDSSVEGSVDSSGEELLLDDISYEDSTSDEDWEVSPRKRKRPNLSSVSPSPAKSNRSASPGSAKKGKGKAKDKKNTAKRSLSFSLGISDDKWHTADEPDIEPTPPCFRPMRNPGPQLLSSASYSPLQFFQLFFSSSTMLKIVANSNAYGASVRAERNQSWKDISVKDFKSFLSMVIYMGLIKCFNITDYWKKADVYSLPYPLRVMTSRKFLNISSALHLSDPKEDAENDKKKGTPEYDRLFRIKPLYDNIRETCKTYLHPFQNISIDERMVASKARNGLKQYMKNKPTKWGYKLFVLADSLSGYTWDFFIYEGKTTHKVSDPKQRKGVGYETVMALVNEKVLGNGYKLFVDNFYTSPALFRDLLSKKIYACGTLRANRIGRLKATAPRGSIRWFRDDKLLFVEWKDRRNVLMCSSFHKAFNGDKVTRKVKGDDGVWNEEQFPIPPAVLDYNKYMGGVDLSDALIGYYTVLHKTRKWYRSFFYHFVDIAVVNAFILHKHVAKSKNQKPMTQKEFREALVSELAETEPLPLPSQVRKDAPKNLHLPKYISGDSTVGRRSCRVCHSKTPVKCVSCDASLCLVSTRNCFTIWHKEGYVKEENKKVTLKEEIKEEEVEIKVEEVEVTLDAEPEA
ncbi:piggyBac transposable element-derived protein 4 [Misgurnus anguillicaudatus]|uniref:piggyBac transposable element-derived protein 4 n=1 Tax=Misgurnus anguillicaudatus TaxID=75329 RepID=UPI002435BD30|nr:piggyBac transposable element-derived protein 4-like [Misgurnus anguillicaudatus]